MGADTARNFRARFHGADSLTEVSAEMRSEIATRIELICGLLAGLLGVLGIIYVTAGPIYRNSEGGTATLVQINGLQVLTVVFVLLLLVVGVPAGAYLHARNRRTAGLVLLWSAEILLALGRVITGFSIGIFLQPTAALGLISAVSGSLAGRHPVLGNLPGLGILWAASSLLFFVALSHGDTATRIGESLVSGPWFLLQLLFDPRQLTPLVSR